EPYPAAPVPLEHGPRASQLDDLRQRFGREIPGTFQQVGGLVVRHRQRNRVKGVTAGDSSADMSGHDIAPLALGVAQVSQRITGDSTSRKRKRGFLLLCQRSRTMAALVRQRSR